MMKKFLFIVFTLSCIITSAQAPSWAWEEGVGGNLGGHAANDNYQTIGYNLITDANGNVYSVGVFQTPTMVIGTYTLTNTDNTGSTPNLFIIKYDAIGNVLWAKSALGSNDGGWMDIAIDAASNIYITGGFTSQTITFDTKTLTKTSTEGMDDIYMVKYTAAGNIIWAKSFGGSNDDNGNAITIDAANNIYITGNYKSTSFIIDTYTLTNDTSGNPNMFVAKFDSSGNALFAKNVGKSCTIAVTGNNIISDNNNNIYVTGGYNNPNLVIGNDTLLCNSNSYNAFLVKYDALGNILWARGAARGANYSIIANDVTIDALGNPYIVGNFKGDSLIIGHDSLSVTWTTGFMVKYSASGNVVWARNLKTNTTDFSTSANHITTDVINGIYVGGGFINQINGLPPLVFGNDTLLNGSPGSAAIYIAKYDTTGNAIWGKTAKSTSWNEISELTIDKYGNIYAVGSFNAQNFIFDNDTLHNLNGQLPTYSILTPDYFIAKIGTAGVGIKDYNLTSNIIYPNPSSGNINIVSTSNIDNIKITDIVGQIVYELKPNVEKTTLQINNTGIYFVTITSGKEISTKKIIVNK